MDWLVQIINSPNFLKVAITTLILIAIVWLLVKSGVLTIHTKYVSLGIADNERNIIRYQLNYAKQVCNAFTQFIPKKEGYDEYRGRYVAELVFDEMVDWIVLNHIEDSEVYISLKQKAIWNIIISNSVKPEHQTDEFKNVVYKHVAEDIKTLLKIRKTYTKNQS